VERVAEEMRQAILKAAKDSFPTIQATGAPFCNKEVSSLWKLIRSLNMGVRLRYKNQVVAARKSLSRFGVLNWLNTEFSDPKAAVEIFLNDPDNMDDFRKTVRRVTRRIHVQIKLIKDRLLKEGIEEFTEALEKMCMKGESSAFLQFTEKRSGSSGVRAVLLEDGSVATDPEDVKRAIEAHETVIAEIADPPKWSGAEPPPLERVRTLLPECTPQLEHLFG